MKASVHAGAGGQASVEAVAGIASLLLAGFVCFQILAAGYSATMADSAANAGAVAMVRGESVPEAVRSALPGWARSRFEVERGPDRVTVRLTPPMLLDSLAERMAFTSSAEARSR